MTGKISEDTAATTLVGVSYAGIQGGANVRVPQTLLDTEFMTSAEVTTALGSYATTAAVVAGYQPLDADLTSWAAVTRASGFDAWVASPTSANLRTLVTDEVGSGSLVFGPASTVDNTLPRFDSTAGALQTSGVVIDDSNNVTGVAGLSVSGLLDLSAAGAGQIKFPGTQNSSTDLNTLDDVEEGTFTPGASFGGGTTGITYTTQTGRYFKIGRWVMFMLNLILSNKGSSTGNALITGLPFSVAVSATPPNFVGWAGMASLGSLGALVSGTTIVPHNQGAAAVTQLTDANFTNSSNVYSAGAYMAAS